MTGGNTDPVSTPPYMQASTILLKLARPLFDVWMKSNDHDPLERHYNGWFQLRTFASYMLEQRNVTLSARQTADLVGALGVAHQLAHDTKPDQTEQFDHCHCRVAEMIRDLAVVIAGEVVLV